MNWVLGFASGVTMFLVGLFHLTIPIFAPSLQAEYGGHPELFRSWSGWTRIYMAVHPVVYGFLFSFAFALFNERRFIRGPGGGPLFGVLVFLVGSMPVFLITHASVRLPALITVGWTVQNLTQYVTAGLVLGWIGPKFRPEKIDNKEVAENCGIPHSIVSACFVEVPRLHRPDCPSVRAGGAST